MASVLLREYCPPHFWKHLWELAHSVARRLAAEYRPCSVVVRCPLSKPARLLHRLRSNLRPTIPQSRLTPIAVPRHASCPFRAIAGRFVSAHESCGESGLAL